MSKTAHDPALVDFLLENKVALKILKVLGEIGSEKSEGWVKVPDIVAKLQAINEFRKFKNLKSTVHYFCKRLYQRYGAIDKYENHRPTYYRLNDKGKRHLSRIEERKKGEGD